jgi:hypothetical protein
LPFDFRAEGGWIVVRLDQLSVRTDDLLPAGLLRRSVSSGQVVEQAGLERLQRLLFVAEKVGLGRALSLSVWQSNA